MIKFLFCLFLSCVSLLTISAQERVKALCFRTINGTVYVSLKQEVTCSFENVDEMCISADGRNKLKLKFSDISYHFVKEVDIDKTTSIPILLHKQDIFVKSIINYGFLVSGLSEGETVRIMTIDGRILDKVNADRYGRVVINTSKYSKGVYILTMSFHRSLKIQKI